MQDRADAPAAEPTDLFAYRPDIDGLRAVAVLSVIVFHLRESWLAGGFAGVDVFFVISGYVVTASLMRRDGRSDDRAGLDYLLDFYSRRVKRLGPALIACTIATAIATTLVVPPSSTGSIFTAGLAGLVGVSNFYFAYEAGNYFGLLGALNPYTQTWSLGAEEQFYLVYPLFLILAFAGRPARAGRTGVPILAGSLVVSALFSAGLTRTDPNLAFYLMPSRFWELAMGAVLFAAFARGHRPRFRGAATRASIQLAIVVSIAASMVYAAPQDWIPFPVVVPAVVGTALFIALGSSGSTPLGRAVGSRPMVYIGRISYSLYLFHWPVFTLFRWTVGLETWPLAAIALALTFGLAIASFHLLEQPIRRWRPTRRRFAFAAVGAAVASCAAVVLALAVPLRGVAYVGERSAPPRWLEQAACHLPKAPDPISHCLTPAGAAGNGERVIYAMGDSHAGNLVPALDELATQRGAQLRYLTDRALVNDLFGVERCGGTACVEEELEARLLFLAEHLSAGDLVVFSLDRKRLFPGSQAERSLHFSAAEIDALGEERVTQLVDALGRLAAVVADAGATLLLVDDIPFIGKSYGRCVNGFADPQECRVERETSRRQRRPLTRAMHVADELPGTLYWDPHDLLCADGFCSYFAEGELIYADGSPHLTRDSARALWSELDAFLRAEGLL